METSPFDLGNKDAYARWRDAKLKDYPTKIEWETICFPGY